MNISIAGRRYVVTGGAGGIGRQLCACIQELGGTAISIDKEVLPPELGVVSIQADFSVSGVAREAVMEATRVHGALDGIVNCVGYYSCRDQRTFAWNEFDLSFQINARAPIEAVLAWSETRPSRDDTGVVINVLSAAARIGSRDLAYTASKAALEGATKSLARWFAPRGIPVIGVSPGLIDSPMSRQMPAARAQEHVQRTLLKRAGRADEVARFIAILLDRRTEYLSGTIIPFSCGLVC